MKLITLHRLIILHRLISITLHGLITLHRLAGLFGSHMPSLYITNSQTLSHKFQGWACMTYETGFLNLCINTRVQNILSFEEIKRTKLHHPRLSTGNVTRKPVFPYKAI